MLLTWCPYTACLHLKAFWRLLVLWHEHPSIVDDAIQLGVLIQKLVSKLLNRSASTYTAAISSFKCMLTWVSVRARVTHLSAELT